MSFFPTSYIPKQSLFPITYYPAPTKSWKDQNFSERCQRVLDVALPHIWMYSGDYFFCLSVVVRPRLFALSDCYVKYKNDQNEENFDLFKKEAIKAVGSLLSVVVVNSVGKHFVSESSPVSDSVSWLSCFNVVFALIEIGSSIFHHPAKNDTEDLSDDCVEERSDDHVEDLSDGGAKKIQTVIDNVLFLVCLYNPSWRLVYFFARAARYASAAEQELVAGRWLESLGYFGLCVSNYQIFMKRE